MTLTSIKNNNTIRIPTLLLLIGLLTVSVFFFKNQKEVDADQNKQIEKKVDRVEYYQTVDRIDKKLDKIIEWIMP